MSESDFCPRFIGSLHRQSSVPKHIKVNCQCKTLTTKR